MKRLVTITTVGAILLVGATVASAGTSVVTHTHRFLVLRTKTGAIVLRLNARSRFNLREVKPHTFRYRVTLGSGRVREATFNDFTSMSITTERVG